MIIQKGGRHMGKTAQAKLESFDALLDAYMELVEEKKKQDPSYKPKIVYIGTKYAKPKPRTNFDKITENAEAFAKWFVELSKTKSIDCDFTYYYNLGTPRYGKWTEDKEEAINGAIEWLQRECD